MKQSNLITMLMILMIILVLFCALIGCSLLQAESSLVHNLGYASIICGMVMGMVTGFMAKKMV